MQEPSVIIKAKAERKTISGKIKRANLLIALTMC
jgi:hypothetical protein